jgi:hypothetical protein
MRFIPVLALILIVICGLGLVMASVQKYWFKPGFVSQNYVGSTKLSELKPNRDVCSAKSYLDFYYYSPPQASQHKNNKFGIYLYAENSRFFELAQELVNSNGGDWGYVLIPYNVKDRDREKWENVFSLLISKRLIPVIQLHDIDTDDYERQTKRAADFLSSFVWPVRQKYISAYNEMNDAKFWYGRIDAAEYAKILDFTIDTFKSKDADFFVMNGAFNISARTSNSYLDATQYMTQMNAAVPGIFDKLDGWASHPYPQPNFTGSPRDTGRDSIRAYDFELFFLKNSLGLKKDLPVFITETGWPHAEGAAYNSSYLPAEEVADNYVEAFEDVWLKDDKVQAVMPFTIWFDNPYDHFSWVNTDYVPYAQYQALRKIEKISGEPERLQSSKIRLVSCQ